MNIAANLILHEGWHVKLSVLLRQQALVGDDAFYEGCWGDIKAWVPNLQQNTVLFRMNQSMQTPHCSAENAMPISILDTPPLKAYVLYHHNPRVLSQCLVRGNISLVSTLAHAIMYVEHLDLHQLEKQGTVSGCQSML